MPQSEQCAVRQGSAHLQESRNTF